MADLDLDAVERDHSDCTDFGCEVLDLVAELRRLHSWGGLLSLLDQHWPADVFPTPEGLDAAKSTTRRDTGPVVLGLIRWVDKLAAELAKEQALNRAMSDDCDEEQERLERRAEAAEQAVARVRELADEWGTRLCISGYRIRNDQDSDSECLHCAADALRRSLDGPATPEEER